ncbi:MAG: hypothetical protein B7Z73_05525 [Planctomycetia bacterium 21-64-5]|nr:MAG: hypothetical protein B7Z73_05525 [Planctomycetia bacterium 21-64-5]
MRRSGVTLVELLVVILIMLLITAVAIPVIAPAMSGRQVREAARLLDVFINGARTRALQSDTGFGVMIQRNPNDPRMSTTLVYCAQPPNYAGDFQISTIRMLGNGGFGAWQTYLPGPPGLVPTGTFLVDATSPVFPKNDIGWIDNVGPGDTFFLHGSDLTLYRIYSGEPYIDLNGDGLYTAGEPFNDVDYSGGYTPPTLPLDANGCFTSVPTPVVWHTQSATVTYAFADPFLASQCMSSTGLNPVNGLPFWVDTTGSNSSILGWPPSGWSEDKNDRIPPTGGIPNTSVGIVFQIERRPVISSAPPLELPEGTCIDLGGTWLDTTNNVQVPIVGSGMDVPASMLTSGGAGTLISMATFRPNPALDPAVTTNPPAVDQSPVIIMFLPDGRLKSVYSWYENNFTVPLGWQARPAISPIYLLVGRVDLMGGDGVLAHIGDPTLVGNLKSGNAPLAPIFNMQDTQSLWVTVGNTAGRVSVVENAGFDGIPGITLRDPIPTSTSPPRLQAYLNEQAYFSRRLAREQSEMGGR